MDKLKSFAIVLLMLFSEAICIPLESSDERTNGYGVADEAETSLRNFTDFTSGSTLGQYVRDLYEEYTTESRKLQYGADKPTDVWCFPDKGIANFFLRNVRGYISVASFPLQMLPKDAFEPNQRGTQSVQHTHTTSSSGVLWFVRFRTQHSVSGAVS